MILLPFVAMPDILRLTSTALFHNLMQIVLVLQRGNLPLDIK